MRSYILSVAPLCAALAMTVGCNGAGSGDVQRYRFAREMHMAGDPLHSRPPCSGTGVSIYELHGSSRWRMIDSTPPCDQGNGKPVVLDGEVWGTYERIGDNVRFFADSARFGQPVTRHVGQWSDPGVIKGDTLFIRPAADSTAPPARFVRVRG
jgi:hypothetical protein